MELGTTSRRRPSSLMSTQRNKVHRVTTIARVAIELGVDEDWLWDIANEMEPEDGLIWVYGQGDDGGMAFSEDGIECLRELIAMHKANPETNQD
jgi:hypothetical protein